MGERRVAWVFALALGSIAGGAGGAAAQGAPGFAYTIKVTGSSPSAMPGVTGGPGSQSYVGRASVTPARGRLDITEGGVETLFAKGDYLLFDSTDVVVVHPAQKEYMAITREGSNRAMARLESLGVAIQLTDEKVVLDSIGPGDTISAVPTRRYRLTMAFNMGMSAGPIQQRLGSETVTEYWTGTIPGFPSNPLLRSNGLAGAAMTGMFKSLSERVDSVSRRMGRTVALRSISTTRINAGPGQVMESRQSSEVSDLVRRDVDESLLIIPQDYREVWPPGVEGAPSAAAAAKWKTLPTKRGPAR